MDRAVVIAFAALGIALAALIGGGVGFLYLAADPGLQVERQCASSHCRNLKFSVRTPNRVVYTYDQPDGMHCSGYEQVNRGGPFGLATGGAGGTGCSGTPGQPAPAMGAPGAVPMAPPPPTPFADGIPPCAYGQLTFAGPQLSANGFTITGANSSGATCDVSGPAKALFLDSSNRSMNISVQFASDPVAPVVLPPSASVVFAFDAGRASPCQAVARVVLMGAVTSAPISTPGLKVCGPVTAHAAVAAS